MNSDAHDARDTHSVANQLITQRLALAYAVRGELVCCDSYDRHRPRTDDAPDPEDHPDFHAICYWGEAAARLVEGRRDEEDECDHAAGSYFDRIVCPAPCGRMHDRCHTCGEPFDECAHRVYANFTADAVRRAVADFKTRTDPRVIAQAAEIGRLRERVRELERDWMWLAALENAGVYDWSGYDYAHKLHAQYILEEEDEEDE